MKECEKVHRVLAKRQEEVGQTFSEQNFSNSPKGTTAECPVSRSTWWRSGRAHQDAEQPSWMRTRRGKTLMHGSK